MGRAVSTVGTVDVRKFCQLDDWLKINVIALAGIFIAQTSIATTSLRYAAVAIDSVTYTNLQVFAPGFSF